MPKVLVQLTLSTVGTEGENHRTSAVIEMESKPGEDLAASVLSNINAVMKDESALLNLPMGKGHMSVRGSEISWAYVENIEEQTPVNDLNLTGAAIPDDAPTSIKDVLPMPKKKKKR